MDRKKISLKRFIDKNHIEIHETDRLTTKNTWMKKCKDGNIYYKKQWVYWPWRLIKIEEDSKKYDHRYILEIGHLSFPHKTKYFASAIYSFFLPVKEFFILSLRGVEIPGINLGTEEEPYYYVGSVDYFASDEPNFMFREMRLDFPRASVPIIFGNCKKMGPLRALFEIFGYGTDRVAGIPCQKSLVIHWEKLVDHLKK